MVVVEVVETNYLVAAAAAAAVVVVVVVRVVVVRIANQSFVAYDPSMNHLTRWLCYYYYYCNWVSWVIPTKIYFDSYSIDWTYYYYGWCYYYHHHDVVVVVVVVMPYYDY